MQQVHESPKKRFSEEETLDKVEKKINDRIEKIIMYPFVKKVLRLPFFTYILNYHIVNDANHQLKKHLETIFRIIAYFFLVVGLISVVFEFFAVLLAIRDMIFYFGFESLIDLIKDILLLLFYLMTFFVWIGMLSYKKRSVPLLVLWFLVSGVLLLFSVIFTLFYSDPGYWSFGGNLFTFFITFFVTILALKNEAMFTQ